MRERHFATSAAFDSWPSLLRPENSAKLVANRPGTSRMSVSSCGPRLLSHMGVANGSGFVLPRTLGLDNRERGWSGAMAMRRSIAASPFERRLEPDVLPIPAPMFAHSKL